MYQNRRVTQFAEEILQGRRNSLEKAPPKVYITWNYLRISVFGSVARSQTTTTKVRWNGEIIQHLKKIIKRDYMEEQDRKSIFPLHLMRLTIPKLSLATYRCQQLSAASVHSYQSDQVKPIPTHYIVS